MRNFLAIAEISLAMALLVAGDLLLRGFALVMSVKPGFDPENVIEAQVSLPQFQYSTARQWTAFSNNLLERLHAPPGLQYSALAAPLPMDRQGRASFGFSIVGDPPLPPGKSTSADYVTVSPDYFGVMGIPLLRRQPGPMMYVPLGQGAKLALLGLGTGALTALLLTRFIASLLHGVSATDPLTFGAVAVVLLDVAGIACYIPARRAMRVDPMIALRHE